MIKLLMMTLALDGSALLDCTAVHEAAPVLPAEAIVVGYNWDHNDSLRWVWQQLPTVAARYAEALLRLQAGEYATAQTLMDDLDEDHKRSMSA